MSNSEREAELLASGELMMWQTRFACYNFEANELCLAYSRRRSRRIKAIFSFNYFLHYNANA